MRLLRGSVTLGVAAALLGGCGGTVPYANNPRPPQLVTITAAITPRQVRLSPTKLGGGPALLVLANETRTSQEVTVSSSTGGLQLQSGPINPSGTATLKLDLRPGTYDVTTGSGAIAPARIIVSGTRPSAQNQLLLP